LQHLEATLLSRNIVHDGRSRDLFGLLRLLHLFDLAPLTLDLPLLLLHLALRLLLLRFLRLHLATDGIAANSTHRATDCRAGARMADCGTDYGTSTSAQHGTDPGGFFTRRQGLSSASAQKQDCREHYADAA
jgi:hypothetical protein